MLMRVLFIYIFCLILGRFEKPGAESSIMSWTIDDESSDGCAIGDLGSTPSGELNTSTKSDDEMPFELLPLGNILTLRGKGSGDVTSSGRKRHWESSTNSSNNAGNTHASDAANSDDLLFKADGDSVLLNPQKEKIRRTDSGTYTICKHVTKKDKENFIQKHLFGLIIRYM